MSKLFQIGGSNDQMPAMFIKQKQGNGDKGTITHQIPHPRPFWVTEGSVLKVSFYSLLRHLLLCPPHLNHSQPRENQDSYHLTVASHSRTSNVNIWKEIIRRATQKARKPAINHPMYECTQRRPKGLQ